MDRGQVRWIGVEAQRNAPMISLQAMNPQAVF